MNMSDSFKDKLNSWLAGCQQIINDHTAQNYKNLVPSVLTIEEGSKYIRIVSTSDGGKGQRSAWAFINKENGDILKTASWKAPAKHARGNVLAPDNGLTGMGPYGPPYLR